MNLRQLSLIAVCALSCGSLYAANDSDYKASRDRVDADYKAEAAGCDKLSGNAKDICMAEAKGQEKVAKAELKAKENDTPKNRYDVAVAKADADYMVAKEKCDDMKGKEKRQCDKDAKAAKDSAKKQAKADKDAASPKKERKMEKEAK